MTRDAQSKDQKGHVLLCSLLWLRTPVLLFWQCTALSPTKWGCCHIQSCLCCPAAPQQGQHPVQYRADPGASAHTPDNLAPQEETEQFLKGRKREAVEGGGGTGERPCLSSESLLVRLSDPDTTYTIVSSCMKPFHWAPSKLREVIVIHNRDGCCEHHPIMIHIFSEFNL